MKKEESKMRKNYNSIKNINNLRIFKNNVKKQRKI